MSPVINVSLSFAEECSSYRYNNDTQRPQKQWQKTWKPSVKQSLLQKVSRVFEWHTDVFILSLHEKFFQFFLLLNCPLSSIDTSGSGSGSDLCTSSLTGRSHVWEMTWQVVAIAGNWWCVRLLATKHLVTSVTPQSHYYSYSFKFVIARLPHIKQDFSALHNAVFQCLLWPCNKIIFQMQSYIQLVQSHRSKSTFDALRTE